MSLRVVFFFLQTTAYWMRIGDWRSDVCSSDLNEFQVQLRGVRIELGEIETNLVAHESVAQAVVVASEERPGDVRLVAYVVARPGAQADPDPLSAHLKALPPDYKVTQHLVALDTIPLPPHGKADCKERKRGV